MNKGLTVSACLESAIGFCFTEGRGPLPIQRCGRSTGSSASPTMSAAGHMGARGQRRKRCTRRAAAITTAVVAVRAGGRRVVFGALLLVVSSVCFAVAGVHIYWPRGVLTMLAMALAFGWLALTVPRTGMIRPGTRWSPLPPRRARGHQEEVTGPQSGRLRARNGVTARRAVKLPALAV